MNVEPYVIVITYRAFAPGGACLLENAAHGQVAHARRGAPDRGQYRQAAGYSAISFVADQIKS